MSKSEVGGQSEPKEMAKVQTTYCSLCMVPQPLRTTHCFRCKHCVCTRDHHSFWVGNCIGEQNRKFYFIWMVLVLLQAMLGTILTYRILGVNKPYPILVVLSLIIASILEMFMVPVLCGMILFNLWLACINATAREVFGNTSKF